MSLAQPQPHRRMHLDDAVRDVLLRGALDDARLGRQQLPTLSHLHIWHAYADEEMLPPQVVDGLEEVSRRYGVPSLGKRFVNQVQVYAERNEMLGLAYDPAAATAQMARAAAAIGGPLALSLLPDEGFLGAYEAAARMVTRESSNGSGRAQYMLDHANKVFAKYGLLYGVKNGTIVWHGDAVLRDTVMEPVLDALDDPRLSGARAEFVEARAALRVGTPDKLRDATHEAGNAVEAVLHALIGAHGVNPPRARTAAPLFNALRDQGVIPASFESVVMAAPLLRNAQGGHTQGPVVTGADRGIAEAAVGAAAVAITALVRYL